MDIQLWPKGLIILGLLIAAVGALALLLQRYTHLRLGRLPLDFYIERDGFTFYFPLGSCILLSVLISLVFWLINGTKS